uniref:Uncharacterized protein n=1 Tax=Neobodo designis TaxID=312471 RepID=A0A7S1QYW5_NEODS
MARVLHRAALIALVGLALLLSTESAGVEAYGGRRAAARHGGGSNDYLAELTAEDLRITLTERGIDFPADASRSELARLVRDADQRAVAAEVAAETNGASPTAALSHPVRVLVRYCVG